MPFAKINGLITYYEVHGRGETIFLLHNGFSCVRMWEEVYPGLAENGYQVVMYDRRGYGRSDGGPDFEEFYNGESFRAENAAGLEALRRKLGLETFHIVGQCEGGVVGVDYALEHPGRVKTLSTGSTLCFSGQTMEELNTGKFPDSFEGLTPEIQQKYVYWHGPDRAELIFNLASRYGGEYGRGVFDLRPLLKQVKCPTLVMYPDRGHFFPVEQSLTFYRHLPQGELAVFPRCGHNIHEHYPEQYVRQVLRFLSRYKEE